MNTLPNIRYNSPDETGLPIPLAHALLPIHRHADHTDRYPELKDPCVVSNPDGTYLMYASVGSSVTQQWIVGRFHASSLSGPWTELSPTRIIGIHGPQLCAPAVIHEQHENNNKWTMYIQTACFEENGVIASASSADGETFSGVSASVMTRETLDENQPSIVGVYDAGISEIRYNNEEYLVMLFSGYRRVGCGDIYLSYKKKTDPDNAWSKAKNVLAQENVPFHNHPSYEHFEWGLEGAKVIQLNDSLFLMIGVCFLPLPKQYDGQRQRIFFALSHRFDGPFTPLNIPFYAPINIANPSEQGHPDMLIKGEELWIIYQERKGANMPWYLRFARYNLADFTRFFVRYLQDTPANNPSFIPSETFPAVEYTIAD